MTCAGRGVSLEQRTHRPVMFQSFFVTWHFVRGVEDAAHRTDARDCAQRHRPVAFATEGLRLVLCFPFIWESEHNRENESTGLFRKGESYGWRRFASRQPHPWTDGIIPGRTKSFQTSTLMFVKAGLPNSSSRAGMTWRAMAAPPGTATASASGASFAASRPTSSAILNPSSRDMANASAAHWFLLVMPTTLIPPASR